MLSHPENVAVSEAITKSLGKTYENPDILLCITTEDLMVEANNRGVVLTLDEARQIGRKAFRHFESADALEALSMELTDFLERK